MTTMNISLPASLKAFVDQEVSAKGFGSSSEYVRALIRSEQERQLLRNLMLEGASSELTGEADAAYFNTLRARIGHRSK